MKDVSIYLFIHPNFLSSISLCVYNLKKDIHVHIYRTVIDFRKFYTDKIKILSNPMSIFKFCQLSQ